MLCSHTINIVIVIDPGPTVDVLSAFSGNDFLDHGWSRLERLLTEHIKNNKVVV